METVIGGIIVAFIGAVVSYFTVRANRAGQKDDNAQGWYDQMQEDRKRDDEKHDRDMAALNTRYEHLEAEVARLRTQNNILTEYVAQLRVHIVNGAPPPPPTPPEGLS